MNFQNINNIFFIGVAGTGMSALAQYCAGIGKTVSGSDRYFEANNFNHTQEKLEKFRVKCFPQDASGIAENTELIVISTAVEDSNIEIQKAKQLNIPIIKRSELLSLISDTKKTIAVIDSLKRSVRLNSPVLTMPTTSASIINPSTSSMTAAPKTIRAAFV